MCIRDSYMIPTMNFSGNGHDSKVRNILNNFLKITFMLNIFFKNEISRKVRHLKKNQLHIWNQRTKAYYKNVKLKKKKYIYFFFKNEISRKVRHLQKNQLHIWNKRIKLITCLLYTSDAADERSSVDLGGRRIIKKK